MRLDKYSNPIFTEQDLFDALYQNYQFNADDTMLVDQRSDSIKQLESQIGFKLLEPYETHFEVSDYDAACQSNWYMPEEYKTMDIARWVLTQCKNQDQLQRVGAELLEFQRRNMMDLLRWLKYFVDYCRDNKILWGVGRGSSVASYVLYLIGVHKIDPLKYNLDWQDFLR